MTVGTARAAVALTRSGVVRPVRPDRVAGMGALLWRWGNSVTAAFAVGARRHPDRCALVDDEGRLTYAELEQATHRLAVALLADGAGASGAVGVLCRNGRAPVLTLCAAGRVGADVVLLNPGLSSQQLAGVHEQQRLHTVVVDDELAGLLDALPPADDGGPRVVRSEGEGPSTLAALLERGADPTLPPPPLRPPSSRTVVLTSGTTGTPKGARRPHPSSLGPAASVLSAIPLRMGDVVHVAAPLFHTWGNAALLLAGLHGATLVLSRRFEPGPFLRLVEREHCDTVFAVPVMLQRVLEHQDATGANGWAGTWRPRVVAVSGSALPSGFATRFLDGFGECLYNLYGSTEVSWVSIAGPRDLREAPGTAGRAPAGTRLVVLGDDDRPVPVGQEGRVLVGNDLPFDGYTGGQDAPEVRDGLVGTGDLGRLDEQGRLHLTGRADDMIVSGGENVHPGPVEDVVTALPGVREAAVLGVPDEAFGQRLAAWVVPTDDAAGAALTADAVRDAVRERLSRFAVPRDVHVLTQLPRNPTGKVLRGQLPGWSS
ncbi:AMP-binding protein [Lapillicoccus jejuensis]